MKILLLGSGGREHALAWKISQSKLCEQLYIAPGNPGTGQCGANVPISTTDFKSIGEFCLSNHIDMVVVGPEDPLVNGIVDYFRGEDNLRAIAVIGPDKSGAQLEGSKAFAKYFMTRHGIPTPAYREFTADKIDDARRYLSSHSLPIVLKADGLAAGKGVVICQTHEEAIGEMQAMLGGKFGAAGNKVVVEEFLRGIELTVIIITDGRDYFILPPSKDYKKIGDGDTGLNTGGMGAISPPPFATPSFMQKVEEKIIRPTLDGLQKEKINYKGFLYFGLFKCGEDPFVIEFNARMGDPETQVIMPRIKNDILVLFKAVADGELMHTRLVTDTRFCATVVIASQGYPGSFEKGKVITGIENCEDCMVFHAGTRQRDNDDLETAGGRVLAVSSYGNTLDEALAGCYANAGRIYFETRYFRRDIGWDVV